MIGSIHWHTVSMKPPEYHGETELKELQNKTSDNLKTFKETQNKYPHDPNIAKVIAATDKQLIFLNFMIDYIVSDN
ncbi:unnamed protein product [Adineta steineri]|uniref:Uncharacterized protein n=1 Tax=Adineta steineri TaxID=433720 RepID=A0A818SFD6_9BILA|nr:unnamed protein product [Adineta steineri]CAF3666648.1 unnamed protein product [Adineta steineri]